MQEIRFRSLAHGDKYGYTFTNDSGTFWDAAYRTGPILGMSMGKYDTYGDGLVQHSPEYACRAVDFTDYLLSLTSWLVEFPETEFRGSCAGLGSISSQTAEFLASLVSKDSRQWFHMGDMKVSRSESREHDKRWRRVPSTANGTIASAVALWYGEGDTSLTRMNVLTRYSIHNQFHGHLYGKVAQGQEWDNTVAYRSELGKGHELAFEAFRVLVEARCGMERAKEMLRRWAAVHAEASPVEAVVGG